MLNPARQAVDAKLDSVVKMTKTIPQFSCLKRADLRSVDERRLKICLASMAPFVGGAEVAAERLGVGLRAAGQDVFMLLGKSGEVHDRMSRARLRCVVSPMYFTDKWTYPRYWLARRSIRRILCRERPDVIHSNDLPTHQIMSDAARGLSIPRICHHRFPFSGAAIDWLLKFGAERHLFVSNALMNEMCANSPKLRGTDRVVVYDGLPLPPQPTPDTRRTIRGRLGLPMDRVLVTFAGQIIERKGVADLLRAWSIIDAGLRSQSELLVIGDDLEGSGAYRRTMEQLANELGNAVRLVGFQENVGEWLLASDIAVVPSHVEPLGNATLEAMSYALPVIGGDVGGIPEMAVHEQTGLLVPPRDPAHLAEALTRLIRDADMRQRFGSQGRRRCEEVFGLEVHANAVCREYRQVVCPAGMQ